MQERYWGKVLNKEMKDNDMNQIIIVKTKDNSKAILELYKGKHKVFETNAFIGKNGCTVNKKEGDCKTPLGIYNLGIAFGMHKSLKNLRVGYIQINNDLYWVDDVKSKYYNKLVDISKVNKDWNSAEHLIEYPKQYEYAIEIKTNPNNLPGQGSAIFLHCSMGRPTAGCIAIPKEKMLELLKSIGENVLIRIE